MATASEKWLGQSTQLCFTKKDDMVHKWCINGVMGGDVQSTGWEIASTRKWAEYGWRETSQEC